MHKFVTRIAIVNIGDLRPHEETDMMHTYELVRDILARGVLVKPIVIDEASMVILDGHHRFEALKMMGFKSIPVAMVDYFSDAIVVESWRNNIRPTKAEVIDHARSGILYPYKTTRHMVILDGKRYHISEVVPEVNYKVVANASKPGSEVVEKLVRII